VIWITDISWEIGDNVHFGGLEKEFVETVEKEQSDFDFFNFIVMVRLEILLFPKAS
jgi:hypothetical protein